MFERVVIVIQILVPTFDVNFKNKENLKKDIAELSSHISDIQSSPEQESMKPSDGCKDYQIVEQEDVSMNVNDPGVEIDQVVVDEHISMAVDSKQSNSQHRLIRLKFSTSYTYVIFKVISIPFAYDWLYVRVSYVFARTLLEFVMKLINSIKIEIKSKVLKDSEKLNVALSQVGPDSYATDLERKFLPTVPWNRDSRGIKLEDILIRLGERNLWLDEKLKFPSYFDLVTTVGEDFYYGNIFYPRKQDRRNYFYYVINLLTLRTGYYTDLFSDCLIVSQLRNEVLKFGNKFYRIISFTC